MLLFEGDSMMYHLGQKFSTRDQDNDQGGGACAVEFKGAWWYQKCLRVNLNGKHGDAVIWQHWKGYHYSLKFTEMKIRPFN